MNDQRTTVQEVAVRSGVCRQSIAMWRTETMPRVDMLDACLNVLGYRLAVVPIEYP